MTEYEVNPIIWFTEREVTYPPIHFVSAVTPLTAESKQWVLDNLLGRFSITPINIFDLILLTEDNIGSISFEDPKEATLYELKWS